MYAAKMEVRSRRDFTKSELEQHLIYQKETGSFLWRHRVQCFGGGRAAGSVAGTLKNGYVHIKVFGKVYRAHHLVWLMETGEWPDKDKDIDHINRNRSDNRFENIRIATRTQNNANSKTRSGSATGHRGVHKSSNSDKYFARIAVKGKIIHLGSFSKIEDAISARKKAEAEYFGEFSAG